MPEGLRNRRRREQIPSPSTFGSEALFLFLGAQPRNQALHWGVLGMRFTAQRRPPKTYGERSQ